MESMKSATAAMQPTSDAREDDVFFLDEDMLECMAFHPLPLEHGELPFRFKDLRNAQQREAETFRFVENNPDICTLKNLDDNMIVVKLINRNHDDWRIVTPNRMLDSLVRCYHEITAHALAGS